MAFFVYIRINQNNTTMQVLTKFICPMCKAEYDHKEQAQACLDRGVDKTDLKVGDIVELKYGFGWFDGDKRWVINPDVKLKHGFGKNESMGFYYVITHMEAHEHRLRIYVATKAMTGANGHKGGYTYLSGHYTPKKIEAPEEVILDAIDLIGTKLNW
jgi:hypothetical protein